MNNVENSEHIQSFVPVQPVTEALKPRAVGGMNQYPNQEQDQSYPQNMVGGFNSFKSNKSHFDAEPARCLDSVLDREIIDESKNDENNENFRNENNNTARLIQA